MNDKLIKNIKVASDEMLIDVFLSNGLLNANIGTIAELKQFVNDYDQLTADRDKWRDRCERLIGHYGDCELWDEAWNKDGKQTGFADRYLGFEKGVAGDNGYDFAQQIQKEIDDDAN